MADICEEAKAKWSEAFADTVANVAAEKESGTKIDSSGDVMYSEEYENLRKTKTY